MLTWISKAWDSVRTYAAVIGLAIGALGVIIAQVFRGRAQESRHEAEKATESAKAAEAKVEGHERTQAAVEKAEKESREEVKDVEESLAAGRRDQLDSDW